MPVNMDILGDPKEALKIIRTGGLRFNIKGKKSKSVNAKAGQFCSNGQTDVNGVYKCKDNRWKGGGGGNKRGKGKNKAGAAVVHSIKVNNATKRKVYVAIYRVVEKNLCMGVGCVFKPTKGEDLKTARLSEVEERLPGQSDLLSYSEDPSIKPPRGTFVTRLYWSLDASDLGELLPKNTGINTDRIRGLTRNLDITNQNSTFPAAKSTPVPPPLPPKKGGHLKGGALINDILGGLINDDDGQDDDA
jgi:hypothetical protein